MNEKECERYQQLASGFVDSELQASEIEALQDHLKSCDDCRAFLGNAYKVRDLLRAGEAQRKFEPASEGFAGRITARIAREKFTVTAPASRQRSTLPFLGRVSAAAAAAVLILSVGWSWHRFSGPQEGLVAEKETPVALADEGSMASYLSQHAMQSMDATFLGPREGIELASIEVLGQSFE